jgi:hypothetical protein
MNLIFTNHAAGEQIHSSNCMSCNQSPKLKVIENNLLMKLENVSIASHYCS